MCWYSVGVGCIADVSRLLEYEFSKDLRNVGCTALHPHSTITQKQDHISTELSQEPDKKSSSGLI
jgi:hypothetical protein